MSSKATSPKNIAIINKDALYENSLRELLPENKTQSYLLVVDGSHTHECQEFSSLVQTEMATHTMQQTPVSTDTNHQIHHTIFATPSLGNYGNMVCQKKRSLTRGDETLIWIYQEEPEFPQFPLNLPCTVCKQQFSIL